MSQILLTIYNQHGADCGTPSEWSNQDHRYYGYFVGLYGDQWIFVYDPLTRTGKLYGGDTAWETEHQVIEGQVADLVLDSSEAQWLTACWQAATAK